MVGRAQSGSGKDRFGTVAEVSRRSEGAIDGDGFAIRFIPLILTFSHPGEGTTCRRFVVDAGGRRPDQRATSSILYEWGKLFSTMDYFLDRTQSRVAWRA